MDLAIISYQAQGFAMCAHRNQKRKYDGEPYVNHCERVARTVAQYTSDENVVAAAFMHDVLEDTEVTEEEMRRVFGDDITGLVLEVTDISRPSDGKRKVRKEKDKNHLAQSSEGGATIKLADLIDNCISITQHDPGFAKVYLKEADAILRVIKHGNRELWLRAQQTLEQSRAQLESLPTNG